ncbi:hypothetical protein QBC35DRAFT_508217 [Podospora australis]|uniref:SMP-30/Gluconolactonase/LRE-like region domain-containing protein n=1 Tax=Podospora australis TaxID=1536484 RepID=A0AAN6WK18_9PEZI|nr:hypothetical protein QBC35DRAFT_508217 [Podospora australis]
MRFRVSPIAFCSSFLALSGAFPTPNISGPTKIPLPDRIVYQFPNLAWIENIAVRSNGDLILTQLTPKAAVFAIEKPASSSPQIQLVNEFPADVEGLTGIVETTPDTFVFTGGNLHTGEYFAWSVDFNRRPHPVVKQIVQLVDVGLPNGLCTLPWLNHVVLISDSSLGQVWRLNTHTGNFDVAVKVPEMTPVQQGGSGAAATGVNGITIFKGWLYWTNSAAKTIYRLKITRDGSIARGAKVEVVAKLDVGFVDDFAIDLERGIIFVTTGLDNRVWAVDVHPGGKAPVLVVGATNQLTVAGSTSAVFGRTSRDRKVLYVTTSGALSAPVNGTLAEPGKVVGVDTKGFHL